MWKSRLLLSLCVFAALQRPAAASTVLPVDVATQVDQADIIFVGTVVGTESVPVKDGSFAYTYVTFDVEQTIKGASHGRTLTLRFAGGETGEWRYEIDGAPRFAAGGRHLLFVEGNDRLAVPLAGGPFGKLDIIAHPITQEPIVVDGERRAVDGLSGNVWERRGMAVERDGRLRMRTPDVQVISEQGVKITIPEAETAPVTEAAAAAAVIAELRGLVQARSLTPGFQRAAAVQSASPANVPETFRFRAHRPAEK